MTDLITADEATKLLDGATPGPWEADGDPWNRIIWSSAENRVCFMAHSNGLDDARDIATSNLIAAAPDLARSIIALHAQLADAQAAQVMVVERAEKAEAERVSEWNKRRDADSSCNVARAACDTMRAERDRLAAANAVLEAKVAGLAEALKKADTALSDEGYRETQWPRPQIRAALSHIKRGKTNG